MLKRASNLLFCFGASFFSAIFNTGIAGQLHVQFLKLEGGLYTRMGHVLTEFVKFQENGEEPTLEQAAALCTSIQEDVRAVLQDPSFTGNWGQSLLNVSLRLQSHVEKVGIKKVQEFLENDDDKGIKDALQFLKELTHLPGQMKDCKTILEGIATGIPELLKNPGVKNAEGADLMKHLQTIATISSYNQDLLQTLMKDTASDFQVYVEDMAAALNNLVNQLSADHAKWLQLVAKYRPGSTKSIHSGIRIRGCGQD